MLALAFEGVLHLRDAQQLAQRALLRRRLVAQRVHRLGEVAVGHALAGGGLLGRVEQLAIERIVPGQRFAHVKSSNVEIESQM